MTDAATTTAPTGIALNLSESRHEAAGVAGWWTKRDALAALAALRYCGRNRDRNIEAHPAETHLWNFWVIGLPDHYNGHTYLMTRDGKWARGRLRDATPCFCETPCRRGHSAPWVSLPGDLLPATVTHDYRYSAGSMGVIGNDGKPLMSTGLIGQRPAEVLAWGASAWCVACNWSMHDSREATVRGCARGHRAQPETYAGHAVPRRMPTAA